MYVKDTQILQIDIKIEVPSDYSLFFYNLWTFIIWWVKN